MSGGGYQLPHYYFALGCCCLENFREEMVHQKVKTSQTQKERVHLKAEMSQTQTERVPWKERVPQKWGAFQILFQNH